MSCHATANFIANTGLTPEGACAVTELPEDVAAEPLVQELGAGTFLQLVPAFLALFNLFSKEGATVAEVWAQIQVIIAIVRGGSVEELNEERVNFGTILQLVPLIIELVNLFKGGGGSFADILNRILEIVRILKPA